MREKNWKTLLLCLAVPLAAGGIGALLAGGFGESYGAMYKPLLSPPGWVFPVVWTALYLLMGYAGWLVLTSDASEPRRRRALTENSVNFTARQSSFLSTAQAPSPQRQYTADRRKWQQKLSIFEASRLRV